LGAGWLRSALDSYLQSFLLAGAACLAIALIMLISSFDGRRQGMLAAPSSAG